MLCVLVSVCSLCYRLIVAPPIPTLIKYEINAHQFPPVPPTLRVIIMSDLSGWLAGTRPIHQLHSTADRPADCHFLPCVQLDCGHKVTRNGTGCVMSANLRSSPASLIGF